MLALWPVPPGAYISRRIRFHYRRHTGSETGNLSNLSSRIMGHQRLRLDLATGGRYHRPRYVVRTSCMAPYLTYLGLEKSGLSSSLYRYRTHSHKALLQAEQWTTNCVSTHECCNKVCNQTTCQLDSYTLKSHV